MSIRMRAEAWLKRRKIENQNKAYAIVHSELLKLSLNPDSPMEVVEPLVQAANYDTLLVSIDNIIQACQYAIQTGTLGSVIPYKNLQSTMIKFRLLITFFSGSFGFLWL